jgi:hypothetical protein
MVTKLDAMTTGYYLATGKTTLPAVGSAKRSLLDALAVKFNRDWQTETGVEWESLSSDVSAGTAVVGTDTYELSDPINFISKDENNNVTINGQKFKVVSVRQLSRYASSRAVAHVVTDGEHFVKFAQAFTAGDNLAGEEILVPCIIKLDDLTSDASEVLIDQPEWLGERIGAQYAYSFKSLRDMYPDLLDLANDRMESMKSANTTGTESTSTGEDYFMTMGNVGIDC